MPGEDLSAVDQQSEATPMVEAANVMMEKSPVLEAALEVGEESMEEGELEDEEEYDINEQEEEEGGGDDDEEEEVYDDGEPIDPWDDRLLIQAWDAAVLEFKGNPPLQEDQHDTLAYQEKEQRQEKEELNSYSSIGEWQNVDVAIVEPVKKRQAGAADTSGKDANRNNGNKRRRRNNDISSALASQETCIPVADNSDALGSGRLDNNDIASGLAATNDPDLNALLTSWYMAGYQTGYYMASKGSDVSSGRK